MSSPSASVVGRQIGVGIVLVTFVCLVTFMFSFLGTILCAALFGMMVGFSRKWKWQFVLISLLFPAVLLASLHVSSSQSELSWPESLRLASVCFGTFWATYLATRGVFLLEGGGREPSSATLETGRLNQARQPAAASWHELDIGELQGAWSQEVTLPAGRTVRKVIKVDHNELTMSLVGEDGETQLLAKGELQVVKPTHP